MGPSWVKEAAGLLFTHSWRDKDAGPRCPSSHPSCVRYLFGDLGQVTSFLPASLASVKNLPAMQET